ncbi:hypothetical protein ACH5RR_036091 [Cinchona calisaya]|uniref:Uncharacterized protein n=1 Tax=Cinchona calisaya TaxID=153742 RepID=A0ABD2Y277_9GENT
MVRPIMPKTMSENICSLPLAMGLFISVTVLVALCARHSKKFQKNYATKINSDDPKVAPRSPLLLPKKIITNVISNNKQSDSNNNLYRSKNDEESEEARGIINSHPDEEGFGEGGLWQKSILMGEKCQPPEFSGVLFYDSCGNKISELPRSPRAVPLRKYSSFPSAQDAH